MNIIFGLAMMFGVLYLFIRRNWTKLHSKLKPNLYKQIIMFNLDNTINVWIQKIPMDRAFLYNNGEYFMYNRILDVPKFKKNEIE